MALAAGLAVPAEGLRRVAYYDPPGILTVCYGHTGPDVAKSKTYSLAECRALLDADMSAAIDAVDRCVPGLPVNVLAAFSDAAYNLGPKIACNPSASTAARLLKAGDLDGACRQLPRWDKASIAGVMVSLPGLTKRRAAEELLCLTPETPQQKAEPAPAPTPAPAAAPPAPIETGFMAWLKRLFSRSAA